MSVVADGNGDGVLPLVLLPLLVPPPPLSLQFNRSLCYPVLSVSVDVCVLAVCSPGKAVAVVLKLVVNFDKVGQSLCCCCPFPCSLPLVVLYSCSLSLLTKLTTLSLSLLLFFWSVFVVNFITHSACTPSRPPH